LAAGLNEFYFMRTFGLIPAAGKSVRMGRPKLLLPVGAQTVLARVLATVHDGGVTDVLVVTGPGDVALRDAASRQGAHVHTLAEDTPDMRATCVAGLDWIAARWQPAADDGWLLLPADHPTTSPTVIRALLDASRQQDRSIIVPTHGGRRGHPVWLRWTHGEAIRARPPGQGLNQYIRSQAAETLEMPWPDPEILRDLDTPEDYRRVLDA
jgi:molybdenum cofactor cytidylyltransferase